LLLIAAFIKIKALKKLILLLSGIFDSDQIVPNKLVQEKYRIYSTIQLSIEESSLTKRLI